MGVTIPLLFVERRWRCPRCDVTDVTRRGDVHTQMHRCAGLAGILAPLMQAGVKGTIVAVERGDYVGNAKGVRYDGNRRPIMAVNTIRDDGQDTHVLAPCAVSDTRNSRRLYVPRPFR